MRGAVAVTRAVPPFVVTVTVADGGGLAALGDGDGVVGDFRAVDACWPPGVDDAQRVCRSVVSAWLTRTGSCQALAGRGAARDK